MFQRILQLLDESAFVVLENLLWLSFTGHRNQSICYQYTDNINQNPILIWRMNSIPGHTEGTGILQLISAKAAGLSLRLKGKACSCGAQAWQGLLVTLPICVVRVVSTGRGGRHFRPCTTSSSIMTEFVCS